MDELGYLPFSPSGGALLFHLLSKLYERTSVIITTNLSLSEWAQVLGPSLFLVGDMHSVLGGATLIRPMLAQSDFPVVLGSQRNGRLTLWFGWHALTLFWWAQAIVFWRMSTTGVDVGQTTLIVWAVACGFIGFIALVVSKGKHLSWIFFLPVAALLGLVARGH